MKTTQSLAAVGCVLVLSACGGGGGSGGGTTPAQTSTLSTITAADAPKAASNGYAAGYVISQSSSSLANVVTGVSVTPAGVGAVAPVLDLVKQAYGRQGASLLTGITVSDSCSGGGTVTIDATLRNQNTLSNGDTLTMTALNCVENGSTLNGALSITVSGVSGDIINSSTGAVTLDTRFNNFKVASGSTATTLNGDMKIGLSATSATDATVAISGASLQAASQRAGATVATFTLSAYSVAANVHGSTVSSAANFSVAGNANGLGQFAYTVKNLQPFVGTATGVPTSGSLIVNGAGSSVTATVVPNGVRVDYSAKGDGVVTQTSTLSWSDFLAAS
ncbi:hypothetical protein SAMN05428966_10391 [Massilia sp. PDC64]|nr:hypothetical protein [Massilia sp. PDC64]SDD05604.1 hypothetical protein SAMN05428966_10391 [Massilia sp. PDC64]